MQRLEVSGAVRPLYGSLGVKGLRQDTQREYKVSLRCIQIFAFWTLLKWSHHLLHTVGIFIFVHDCHHCHVHVSLACVTYICHKLCYIYMP